MALPGIWALVGLLALLIAILGVVMMRGDDGKSGKIGFGISLFDMIEGATGVKVSKTTRLLWAIAMVALVIGLVLYLRMAGKGHA
jgi:uncharacterized membrane protein